MQAVRIDADASLIVGSVALIGGLAAFLLVLIEGDVGLYFADASTVAVVLLLVGVVLLLIARRRRAPAAYECYVCGYRVP
jgi:hypothetical protein